MRWVKQGLLTAELPSASWAASHLAVPIVHAEEGGGETLYFSARDADGRSHVGRSEISFPDGPPEPSNVPVLAPGDLGTFDDSGVMASCVVPVDGALLLYYIGWRRGVTVPFYTRVGCAVSEDGGASFTRVSRGPILHDDDLDPFFTTSPWVMREGSRWRMWYASCLRWDATVDGPRHVYALRHAESDDGIAWRRDARLCIDFEAEGEYAIARPCVVRDADRYRMWYSVRGDRYRIGYAESEDGVAWERLDAKLGLEPSGTGWESEMVEYPFVHDRAGVRYLLYNGNGYGETGIGYALLEEGG